jgi:hypothetical protein
MRFSLGINYWPRRSAMAMWERFDAGEIGEDFARIAALGFDSVRFFLRWFDFQPAPDRMNPMMLNRLERVMELLAENRLGAMPTLFSGHMSGVNWLPSWTIDPATPGGRFRTITENGEVAGGAGDMYTGALLEAQCLHAREVGHVLRQRVQQRPRAGLGARRRRMEQTADARVATRFGQAGHRWHSRRRYHARPQYPAVVDVRAVGVCNHARLSGV